MAILVADQLSFAWSPDNPLFEKLSLKVGRERVALIGSNGVGKSTLLRLLTRDLRATAGAVTRPERMLWLPQLADRSQSVAAALGIGNRLAALRRLEAGRAAEEDFETMGADWDIESRARTALEKMGVPDAGWDRRLSTLSGGQVMRVRLARAFLERPELLILDEPTNDLDADGMAALYELVDSWSAGLFVVSHDRGVLARVDRILELSTLGLRAYGGAYDVYEQAKSDELEGAQRRLADARKTLNTARRGAQQRKERADRRASQGRRLAPGSQPKMVLNARKQQAQASTGRAQQLGDRQVIAAQDALSEAQAGIEAADPLNFAMPSSGLPTGKRVLDVSGLIVRRPGSDRPVLAGISFGLVGPERVAIRGPNGSGKTTLLQAIAGELRPDAGDVHRGVGRLAFLRQDVHAGAQADSLVAHFLATNPEQTENQARAALARFGFRNTAADRTLDALSGGERLRAALAAVLMSAAPPQLLILDEPTNHMDLDNIGTLERALRAYDGAILAVSHDDWFLDAIGIERVIELAG